MEAQTFEAGGNIYSISRLSVFDQAEIARRFSFVFASFVVKDPKNVPPPEEYARGIVLMANQVPKNDWDYVIHKALSVVRRKVGDTGWQIVQEPTTERLMFDDIDMMTMLVIAWHVIDEHKIPDFFYKPSATTAPAPGPALSS